MNSCARLTFFRTSLYTILITACVGLATPTAFAQLYWDTNGAVAGSGNAGGTWDFIAPNWTTSAGGTLATGTWANGNQARFSAGTDGVGTLNISVPGAVGPAGVVVEEGIINLTSPVAINSTSSILVQRGSSGGATRLQLMGGGTTTTTFVGVGNPLNIGGQIGTATLGIQGSHVLQVNGNFFLGERNTHPGNMDQTGGTVNVTGQLRVAHWPNETSMYDMTAGTLNSSGGLFVGWDGVGDMNVGGTANVSSTAGTTIWRNSDLTVNGNATFSTNVFRVGDGPRGDGTLNIGGSATVTTSTMTIGDDNGFAGTVNQSGGSLTTTGSFLLGHWPNETSSYNMTGGTISLPGIANTEEGAGTLTVGIDGTGDFNHSSGTITAHRMHLNSRLNGLGGISTYDMEGGVLELRAGGITGNVSGGSNFQINLGGGTIRALDNFSIPVPATLTGTNGNTTFDTNGNNITVDGVLSGAGGLIKSGLGTLNLNANNTAAGGATVSQGTLQLGNGGATGQIGGNITLGDAGTGANDAALLVNRSDVNTHPNNITVSALGTGTATIGSNSVAGGPQATIFTGTITLNRPTTMQGTDPDRTTYTNVISGNVGTLTVNGGARTTWEANNTFVGDVVISGAGTVLQVGVVGDQIPDNSNVDVGAGTTLQLNNDDEVINGLNGSGTVQNIVGGNTLTVGAGGATANFSGVIQNGSGTMSLIKIGSGTQTLSGSLSTYTGPTNVNAGILAAAANNALGSSTGDTTVAGGATLGFTGDITYSTMEPVNVTGTGAAGTAGAIDNLSGDNSFNGLITLTGPATVGAQAGSLDLTKGIDNDGNTLTLNPTGGSLTVSGPISGSADLVKTGAGIATLSATNTYEAGTTINDGILNVTGSIGTVGTAGTTVNSGGTLAGDGLVAGDVTVNTGGAVSVGDAASPTGADVSLLTIDGNIEFNSGTTLNLEISDMFGTEGTNAGWDKLLVTGMWDVMNAAPGSITIELSSVEPISETPGLAANFDPTMVSPSLRIIQGLTDDLIESLTNPFVVDASGFLNPQAGRWVTFRIGTDLYLRYIPIPEPATWLITVLGLIAAWGIHTRRRRKKN